MLARRAFYFKAVALIRIVHSCNRRTISLCKVELETSRRHHVEGKKPQRRKRLPRFQNDWRMMQHCDGEHVFFLFFYFIFILFIYLFFLWTASRLEPRPHWQQSACWDKPYDVLPTVVRARTGTFRGRAVATHERSRSVAKCSASLKIERTEMKTHLAVAWSNIQALFPRIHYLFTYCYL